MNFIKTAEFKNIKNYKQSQYNILMYFIKRCSPKNYKIFATKLLKTLQIVHFKKIQKNTKYKKIQNTESLIHNFYMQYKHQFLFNKLNLVGSPLHKFNFDLMTFKSWKLKNICENNIIQTNNLILRTNIHKTAQNYNDSLYNFLRQSSFLKTNSNLKFLQNKLYLNNLNKTSFNYNIFIKLISNPTIISKNKHSKPYIFTNSFNINTLSKLNNLFDSCLIKFSKIKYEKNTLKKKRKRLFSMLLSSNSSSTSTCFVNSKLNFKALKFLKKNTKLTTIIKPTLRKNKIKIYKFFKVTFYRQPNYFFLKNYFTATYKIYKNINFFIKSKVINNSNLSKSEKIVKIQSKMLNLSLRHTNPLKFVFFKNDFFINNKFDVFKKCNKANLITYTFMDKPILFNWRNLFENIFHIVNTNNINTIFNYNPIYITPKHNTFIFKNIGIFLSQQLGLFNNSKHKYKYNLKKKIFSFLKLNQSKQSLMSKKKKIIVSRFFLKNKLFSFKFLKFSFKLLKKKFKTYSVDTLRNKLFFNKINTQQHLSSINFKTSKQDILYTNIFLTKGDDVSFKKNEIHITRIRFKPGYQRIWRDARNALKESLHVKFQYQYRLTRYLTRFFRQISNYTFNYSEMAINKIIIYSRLLPDQSTFNIFQENKLIYINGKLLFNKNLLVVENDLIQLIISKWYYILYRWLTNWTLLRTRKFKKLIYKKGLSSKHKLMKNRKQKSQHTPTWIYNLRYDISDVKSYLEVDYFTLSTFVLYEPFLLVNYASDDLPDSRINIYKLYNWKYIS